MLHNLCNNKQSACTYKIFKMGDMLLTSDQMKMFSSEAGSKDFRLPDSVWSVQENWSSTENKYLIPFTVHPIRETQEGFRFKPQITGPQSSLNHSIGVNENLKV